MSNPHETWSKLLPHDMNIFTKFHEEWTKIVDFLSMADFERVLVFFSSDFIYKSSISKLHNCSYHNNTGSFSGLNHIITLVSRSLTFSMVIASRVKMMNFHKNTYGGLAIFPSTLTTYIRVPSILNFQIINLITKLINKQSSIFLKKSNK